MDNNDNFEEIIEEYEEVQDGAANNDWGSDITVLSDDQEQETVGGAVATSGGGRIVYVTKYYTGRTSSGAITFNNIIGKYYYSSSISAKARISIGANSVTISKYPGYKGSATGKVTLGSNNTRYVYNFAVTFY